MPVWRPRPEWLRDAACAVLAQRGCELELIVVDDGNPEPVEPYLEDVGDDRVRVLRIPHGGVSRARNEGIAVARGGHLRFVDADDVVEVESTARLVALAGESDDVIAYGATMFCDGRLRPVWRMASRLEGDVRIPCLLGRFDVRPFSLLYPRQVVEATGEFDPALTVNEDWDFLLRALDHACVRGEQEVATYYRKHAAAATIDKAAGEKGARRLVDKYFDRHPEERGRLERRAEAGLLAQAARAYLTAGRPGSALPRLGRALRLDPTAVIFELRRSLPALAGRLRSRRRPARSSRTG